MSFFRRLTNLDLKALTLAATILAAWLLHSTSAMAGPKETIIVAGGCFWCVESDFESVKGVTKAVSGYTGGTTENPTYKDVSKGGTGHYEAVEITYDTGQISLRQILDLYFRSVDPTDAGGQFCDRGESYRTAIFVSNRAEQDIAKAARADAQKALGKKIVTPILAEKPFYKAEAYHQDFYKGTKRIITRFGPVKKSTAYAKYRKGCKRDEKILALWGDAAPFAKGH
ncbi:peptide-methionine (S)-S-oxide reductase MsrA [Halocynthiibacter halioticoli]